MTLSYTQFFRFGIPDFLTAPWHADFQALVVHLDKTLFEVAISHDITVWANSTIYTVGRAVIDPNAGSLWIASIAHTSAVSPTTFSADRLAHPTFWLPLSLDGIPNVQIITAGGTVTVVNNTSKIILNKAVPSVTPIQLPLLTDFTLNELLISDFAGNGGDITITPGTGDKIGGLAANAPWVVGSGGVGLGGSVRLSKIITVGWAVG